MQSQFDSNDSLIVTHRAAKKGSPEKIQFSAVDQGTGFKGLSILTIDTQCWLFRLRDKSPTDCDLDERQFLDALGEMLDDLEDDQVISVIHFVRGPT